MILIDCRNLLNHLVVLVSLYRLDHDEKKSHEIKARNAVAFETAAIASRKAYDDARLILSTPRVS